MNKGAKVDRHQASNPPPHRSRKERRQVLLTIIGAALLLVTYTMKDFVKERTKDVSDALQIAENQYRTELGQSVLSVQALDFRISEELSEINKLNGSSPQHDFSDVVRTDLLICQQMTGDLNSSFAAISRFIEKLPSGADDLKRERERMQESVARANQQITKYLQESSGRPNDWLKATQLKLAIITAGVQEVPVAMLGDLVLTRAKQIREHAETMYSVAQWASYFLYVLGVALALYANLHKIKVLGGGE